MRRCKVRIDRFFRHGQRLAAVVLTMHMAWIVGCGVGEYRERIEARVRELAKSKELAGLYTPQQLGDKPVSVQIPQPFTRSPLVADVPVAEEGAPPAAVRVKPGIVDLPGLTYTYEDFVADADGGQIPFYLYVSAENKTEPGYRDRSEEWRQQVQKQFAGQSIAWESVQCQSPSAEATSWQRLRAEGNQSFYYKDKTGQGREVTLPGVFEMYYRTEGNWAIALVWRVPTAVAGHVNLTKWAPLVAGTVSVQSPSPTTP